MRHLTSSLTRVILPLLLGVALVIAIAYSSQISTQAQITPPFNCDQSVAVNISTATTTRLVTNDATSDSPTKIRVCSLNLTVIGTATANTLIFSYGTGATCGTGNVILSGPFTSDAVAGVMKLLNLTFPFKPVPIGNSLCAATTQAGVIAGTLVYSLF